MDLVTGGTGFIGSHLLYALLQKGRKVSALIRKGASKEQTQRIFSFYTNAPDYLISKINWIEGDILDYPLLEAVMQGAENVYHVAALVSFAPADKYKMLSANIQGTENIVNAALSEGIQKLIYLSSVAAIGTPSEENLFADENCKWMKTNKTSNYSYSKYYAELEVWRGIAEGLNAVMVNPSVVLGPGDWKKGSNALLRTVWENNKFYSDGSSSFVDVRDVVKIMILLADLDIAAERFILTSENISYYDFFCRAARIFNKPVPQIKAGSLLLSFAWRAEMLRSFLLCRKPLITKETTNSAQNRNHFSNEKIKKLLNFDFTPVDVTIQDVLKYVESQKRADKNYQPIEILLNARSVFYFITIRLIVFLPPAFISRK
ncbi:MAG: hypothetical protein A2309_03305 [Bacteroidetes bacterium RIFOXYB2_FULL_35_7]|nr:MAG: hypothetical protein A2X01_17495 [Bacteroidetes bacterium GWF2_35_48]OFY94334.1 MAG: hypothetical protein A2491_00705 [Bacteroidetes bacterium RIFOXYC12_FULL_35_7]OFY97696.1 MAG: hypothetical protein A2309_03305 [Bacteroidetes bacterium RIFOXYB2_FULL_35_7]HBX49626.1 hypothetical protein [Bacteroidales bacterium]